MKKLLISTFAFFLAITLPAQSYNQQVDFGVRAGWGTSSYSNYKSGDIGSAYDFSTWGWGLGMFMQMRVNHLYFQPELFYIKSYIDLTGPVPDDTSVNGDLQLDFSNIQVPLVVGYRTKFEGNALRFGAGLFFNFLVSSKGEYTQTPGSTVPIGEDALNGFNSMSLGARFNLGFDLGDFLFDAHFQSGFSRGEEFATFFGSDLGKATNWGFAVGYKILKSSKKQPNIL